MFEHVIVASLAQGRVPVKLLAQGYSFVLMYAYVSAASWAQGLFSRQALGLRIVIRFDVGACYCDPLGVCSSQNASKSHHEQTCCQYCTHTMPLLVVM